MSAEGGRTDRPEEADSEWDMPDQDPHFLSSFDGACSVPAVVCFHRSSLQ